MFVLIFFIKKRQNSTIFKEYIREGLLKSAFEKNFSKLPPPLKFPLEEFFGVESFFLHSKYKIIVENHINYILSFDYHIPTEWVI